MGEVEVFCSASAFVSTFVGGMSKFMYSEWRRRICHRSLSTRAKCQAGKLLKLSIIELFHLNQLCLPARHWVRASGDVRSKASSKHFVHNLPAWQVLSPQVDT